MTMDVRSAHRKEGFPEREQFKRVLLAGLLRLTPRKYYIYFAARAVALFPFPFFLQASSSTTLRFYASYKYLLYCFVFIYAYEKFGVIFTFTLYSRSLEDGSTGNGLVCFTPAIGIRKAGQLAIRVYLARGKTESTFVSMGEPLRRLCVRKYDI